MAFIALAGSVYLYFTERIVALKTLEEKAKLTDGHLNLISSQLEKLNEQLLKGDSSIKSIQNDIVELKTLGGKLENEDFKNFIKEELINLKKSINGAETELNKIHKNMGDLKYSHVENEEFENLRHKTEDLIKEVATLQGFIKFLDPILRKSLKMGVIYEDGKEKKYLQEGLEDFFKDTYQLLQKGNINKFSWYDARAFDCVGGGEMCAQVNITMYNPNGIKFRHSIIYFQLKDDTEGNFIF